MAIIDLGPVEEPGQPLPSQPQANGPQVPQPRSGFRRPLRTAVTPVPASELPRPATPVAPRPRPVQISIAPPKPAVPTPASGSEEQDRLPLPDVESMPPEEIARMRNGTNEERLLLAMHDVRKNPEQHGLGPAGYGWKYWNQRLVPFQPQGTLDEGPGPYDAVAAAKDAMYLSGPDRLSDESLTNIARIAVNDEILSKEESEKGWLRKGFDIGTMVPVYGAELAGTIGAATFSGGTSLAGNAAIKSAQVAAKVAPALARKAISSYISKMALSKAKKEMLKKAGQFAVGSVVASQFNPLRRVDEAARMAQPELYSTRTGEIKSSTMSPGEAYYNASVDASIENFTELAGPKVMGQILGVATGTIISKLKGTAIGRGISTTLEGVAKKASELKPVQFASSVKSRVAKWYAEKAGIPLPKAMQDLADAARYRGVVGEYMEERYGEGMRIVSDKFFGTSISGDGGVVGNTAGGIYSALKGEYGDAADKFMSALAQTAVEGVGFAIPGAAARGVNASGLLYKHDRKSAQDWVDQGNAVDHHDEEVRAASEKRRKEVATLVDKYEKGGEISRSDFLKAGLPYTLNAQSRKEFAGWVKEYVDARKEGGEAEQMLSDAYANGKAAQGEPGVEGVPGVEQPGQQPQGEPTTPRPAPSVQHDPASAALEAFQATGSVPAAAHVLQDDGTEVIVPINQQVAQQNLQGLATGEGYLPDAFVSEDGTRIPLNRVTGWSNANGEMQWEKPSDAMFSARDRYKKRLKQAELDIQPGPAQQPVSQKKIDREAEKVAARAKAAHDEASAPLPKLPARPSDSARISVGDMVTVDEGRNRSPGKVAAVAENGKYFDVEVPNKDGSTSLLQGVRRKQISSHYPAGHYGEKGAEAEMVRSQQEEKSREKESLSRHQQIADDYADRLSRMSESEVDDLVKDDDQVEERKRRYSAAKDYVERHRGFRRKGEANAIDRIARALIRARRFEGGYELTSIAKDSASRIAAIKKSLPYEKVEDAGDGVFRVTFKDGVSHNIRFVSNEEMRSIASGRERAVEASSLSSAESSDLFGAFDPGNKKDGKPPEVFINADLGGVETIAHEVFHLLRNTGRVSREDYTKLVSRYLPEALADSPKTLDEFLRLQGVGDVREIDNFIEERIASVREAWTGPAGLFERFADYIRSLVGKGGRSVMSRIARGKIGDSGREEGGETDEGVSLSARGTKYRASLSAYTGNIPGLRRLGEEFRLGDDSSGRTINGIAKDALRRLLSGIRQARVVARESVGLYGGSVEPSLGLSAEIDDNDLPKVIAALVKFARNFKQEQVHVRTETSDRVGTVYEDGSYATPVFRFGLKKPLSVAEANKVIAGSGLFGVTVDRDQLEAYYVGDAKDAGEISKFERGVKSAAELLRENIQFIEAVAERLRVYGENAGPGVIGYSEVEGDVHPEGKPGAVYTARRIASRHLGKPVKSFSQREGRVENQEELQRAIAAAYNAMPLDDLSNPDVRKAYEEAAAEIVDQFDRLPIKVDAWAEKGEDGEWSSRGGEPYKSSDDMRKDLVDNNHMHFFTTSPGQFGPEGVTYNDHPLLRDSGRKTENGYPMLVNDVLRVVHDYFAHGLTPTTFGEIGEEAGWRNHMAMTKSPWAKWAITSETRGQNSFVNFRPMLDRSRPNSERDFAPQKVGLLPLRFVLTGDASIDGNVRSLREQIGKSRSTGSVRSSYDDVGGVRFSAAPKKTSVAISKPAETAEEWQEQIDRAIKLSARIKKQDMEAMRVAIPDKVRIVSKNPGKLIDGRSYYELGDKIKEHGEGFLPLQDSDEAAADRMLVRAMQDAVDAAGLGSVASVGQYAPPPKGEGSEARKARLHAREQEEKRTGRLKIRVPSAKEMDTIFRGINQARYWYELSAEGFRDRFFKLDHEALAQLIDMAAATSGGLQPKDQMPLALAAIHQDNAGKPVSVGIRNKGSIGKGLSEDFLITNKFGNFAATMQILAGTRDGIKPLPTIDLQMNDFHDMDEGRSAKDGRVYEAIARFWIAVRDMQNKELEKRGGEFQPYESWQGQALAWVHHRGHRAKPGKENNPDDYGSVMQDVIDQIDAAGIHLDESDPEHKKIDAETLRDERLVKLLAPSAIRFEQSRIATFKSATLLNDIGTEAKKVRDELNGIDAAWAADSRKKYDTIIRDALTAVSSRRNGGKRHSVLSELMSVLIGIKQFNISRTDPYGLGTFEGDANINLRFPFSGTKGTESEALKLNKFAREGLLGLLGEHYKQAAMAASLFTPAKDGQEPDTYSVFVHGYEMEPVSKEKLGELDAALGGHSVNFSMRENGWLIDVNPRFLEGGVMVKPTADQIEAAMREVFGVETRFRLLPMMYSSDYVEAKRYKTVIRRIEREINKRGDGIGDEEAAWGRSEQMDRYAAAIEDLKAAAAQRDAELGEFVRDARARIDRTRARERKRLGLKPSDAMQSASQAEREYVKFSSREAPAEYTRLREDEIPQKTRRVYKLMVILPTRPGELFPLYAADRSRKRGRWSRHGFRLGFWYKAENQAPSGLQERPGVHAVTLPLFLQGKAAVDGQLRVWVEGEMPDVTPEAQAECDASPRLPNGSPEGITERLIGPKESYNYPTSTAPTSAAKKLGVNGDMDWPIAGSVKLVRILTDADVREILRESGNEHLAHLSEVGRTDTKFSAREIEKSNKVDSLRRDNLIEAVSSWANTEGESDVGKRLLGKMSRPGNSVGVRSIVNFLADALGTLVVRTKSQTSRKDPTRYLGRKKIGRKPTGLPYNAIFTRDGRRSLDFNAIGGAFHEAFVSRSEAKYLEFLKYWSPELVKLSEDPDGVASTPGDVSAGLGEAIRKYIEDQGSLKAIEADVVDNGVPKRKTLLEGIEELLKALAPGEYSAIRDTHRLVAKHDARSQEEKARVYNADKGTGGAGVMDSIANAKMHSGKLFKDWMATLYGNASRVHDLLRRAYEDLSDTKQDGLSLVGGVAKLIDPEYSKKTRYAEKELEVIRRTGGDIAAKLNNLNRVSVEVDRAMHGGTGNPTGLRVIAAEDGGFNRILDKETADEMRSLGIPIPRKWSSSGEYVYLTKEVDGKQVQVKLFHEIRKDVGDKEWEDFEQYGQYKTILARHRAYLKKLATWELGGKDGEKPTEPEYPGDFPAVLDPKKPDFDTIEKMVDRYEAAHPKWKDSYQDVQDYMNGLLAIAVLSGELTAADAIRMASAYESYWPLGRQQRDGGGEGTAARSRDLIEIGSDFRRAFGSNLPFNRIRDVIESRTRKVLAAYANNKMLDAFLSFRREMAHRTQDDFAKSTRWMQMFVPLRMDFEKSGEISRQDYAKKIAEYFNKEKLEELGLSSLDELKEKYPEEMVSEADINLSSVDGKMLFKMTTPKMVNVIYRNRNGEGQFLYVPDPSTFQIFQSAPDLAKNFAKLSQAFAILGAAIKPMQRAVTRSLPFAAYNTFYRDMRTAMTTGKGNRSLIPFYYVAKGIQGAIARWSGTASKAQLDALSESYEVMSLSTMPSDFMNMLGEGITHVGDRRLRIGTDFNPSVAGWGVASRNWAGAIASTLLKPIDVANWATFGWWLSPRGEALTRAGAYIDAAEQGYSTEQSLMTADNSTANFNQKSTSPTVNLVSSQAMFFNARLQVGWQFWRQIFHHDPHVRGLAIFKLAYGSVLHAALLASVVMALRMLGDDEWLGEWLKRENERTDEDKSRIGAIPFLGGTSLRIPFDDGLPAMFDSLGYNAALTMLAGDKTREENIATASKIISNATMFGGVEFLSSAINPLVRTALEAEINLRLYDKNRIVPEGVSSISEPRLQTTPSTPKAYSDIADMLDNVGIEWSPMKIRYVLSNVGYKTVDQLISYLDDRNAKDASNAPVIGQLFAREPRGFSSQSVKTLSEFDGKFASAKREYESAVNAGDKERAERSGQAMMALSGYREHWRACERYWAAAKKLKDAGRIEESKEMERLMTETARRALKVMIGVNAMLEKRK